MEFDVMMEPRGKGRPRFTRSGKTYTPAETTAAEKKIAAAYWALQERSYYERNVPIALHVEAYFKVPLSYDKRKTEAALAGDRFPTKKPDGDNILKLVADALNKAAYYDDSQIVYMTIKKKYANHGFLRIRIEEYK